MHMLDIRLFVVVHLHENRHLRMIVCNLLSWFHVHPYNHAVLIDNFHILKIFDEQNKNKRSTCCTWRDWV